MKNLLLLSMIATIAISGIVQTSDGINHPISNPTTTLSSIPSSLILGTDIWTRDRVVENQGPFPESFTLTGFPNCQITCGPYSWPVISSGALYCQRDLTKFSGLNNDGNAYKSFCVPNVKASCPVLKTSFIYSTTLNGQCDFGLISSGNPLYSFNSGSFDCCNNNHNSITGNSFNAFTDKGSNIL